jgi:DNA modification methylase
VQGSDAPESKAKDIEDFQDGKYRVMISKPRIAGFGMNFQNAHNMIFVGLSDSWESYYQCIRREWRFGQKSEVNCYIVLSELEREIYTNVMQKEAMARGMGDELISRIQKYEWEELNMEDTGKDNYQEREAKGENFTAMLGDSAQRLQEIKDASVHLSVYSPPFADLYTYSNSNRDLGNSRNWPEFFSHYAFIIRELLRVTKPGRLTCVHTADIPAMAVKDGYIGMKDFPGAVITAYEAEGWTFVGRAIVGKNPQAQAIRTKAKALLFTQLDKDSSHSRPAILDQILIFKAPGENETPVRPVKNGEMNNETWIDWAAGIWMGISESDTLQFTTARDADDEKHICPLQLGTIERCIKLYSNPGETVLTPFMGIGSEAYQAIKFGRKAIGIELKESYYRIAVKNLKEAEQTYHGDDLFSWAEKQSEESQL